MSDVGKTVTLSAWIQRIRNLGGMTFIDLRDRYGITQITFNMEVNSKLCEQARNLGREYVIQLTGTVAERENKNPNIPTGNIEIIAEEITILSQSEIPPFTIEDETDGGDELRMKYRYLDLRRNIMKNNIILRHMVSLETRKYLEKKHFIDIETPMLIKSTPEGARDYVVPSRINKGQFYALPQSPQLFKQLLMIGGFDRYYQIVKCFRDEDLRADRQPEFTQIDCEMAFVHQKDVLNVFEGMIIHLIKAIKGIEIKNQFPQMHFNEAIENYGTDKPDIRFDMRINELTDIAKNGTFKIFDDAEYVGAICVKGCSNYSRKQLDNLTTFVRSPQVGAKGMVYLKYNQDNSFKSSVDKFYSQADLKSWTVKCKANPGDLLLILSGDKNETLNQLGILRLKMGNDLQLRDNKKFQPVWIVDFPLLKWDTKENRYFAMHHPFTSPKKDDIHLLITQPDKVRANAYDLVINGIEIGGGSIRNHDIELQKKIFKLLSISKKEAQLQFGFLLDALKYGAPPHGGIAFGFDRLVALFAGQESIRDVIVFPKNNAGKDLMSGTPAKIDDEQLKDLGLNLLDSD